MRASGFEGLWCVNLEVYERCVCVCERESNGYMYGPSNQIIKSANKLIKGYKSSGWCSWKKYGNKLVRIGLLRKEDKLD